MTIFRINVYEVAELESRIIPGCHPSRLEAGMEEWFEKKTAEGGIVNANTDNDLEFTMIRLLVKRGMLDNRSISFRYHRANGDTHFIGLGADGGLTDWPKNFFDRYADMSLELL